MWSNGWWFVDSETWRCFDTSFSETCFWCVWVCVVGLFCDSWVLWGQIWSARAGHGGDSMFSELCRETLRKAAVCYTSGRGGSPSTSPPTSPPSSPAKEAKTTANVELANVHRSSGTSGGTSNQQQQQHQQHHEETKQHQDNAGCSINRGPRSHHHQCQQSTSTTTNNVRTEMRDCGTATDRSQSSEHREYVLHSWHFEILRSKKLFLNELINQEGFYIFRH